MLLNFLHLSFILVSMPPMNPLLKFSIKFKTKLVPTLNPLL
ncbi:hypothetical protein KR49_13985 [Synechococcus sp. KORDI-49]|nr:hypothetical protein KR49_13985 [Synechococcus sp. KORDI-49]